VYEECKGCVLFKKNKKNEWCSVIRKGNYKDCPCRICLVKVMCVESCKEYNKHIKIHYTPLSEV